MLSLFELSGLGTTEIRHPLSHIDYVRLPILIVVINDHVYLPAVELQTFLAHGLS